jgi:hypothetical protein
LASLAQFYSPGIRGMRSFVAPLHRMCSRCGPAPGRYRVKASPNAAFAILIWRAASALLQVDREALSVPLDSFVHPPHYPALFDLVSDASPWRLAAALYDSQSHSILAWSTLLLPFAPGGENTFQIHREYLGHLFSLLLLLTFTRDVRPFSGIVPYRWVNDNTGALAWAAQHRCSSISSTLACFAVSQFHLLSPLTLVDSVHLPGVHMGEIDAMSRREIHPDIAQVCPSLTPSIYLDLHSPAVDDLFLLCDPARIPVSLPSLHDSYLSVSQSILTILRPSSE